MRIFLVLCFILPAFAGRSPGSRIVGGEDSGEGDWPHQLALRNGGSFSCGACLLSANSAITAAHCVGSAAALYSIVAGTNQRSCGDGNCEIRTLNTATRHPDFVNSGLVGYPNDIAYLAWAQAIDRVAGKIDYIDMATTTDQTDGRICVISGWGRLTGGGILPENLQHVITDLLTRDECLQYWGAVQVSDDHVCVFDKNSQQTGACNGDSGGPLVCWDSTRDKFELVGLTSWGRTGCLTASPSVYTRISSFIDWVDNQS